MSEASPLRNPALSLELVSDFRLGGTAKVYAFAVRRERTVSNLNGIYTGRERQFLHRRRCSFPLSVDVNLAPRAYG